MGFSSARTHSMTISAGPTKSRYISILCIMPSKVTHLSRLHQQCSAEHKHPAHVSTHFLMTTVLILKSANRCFEFVLKLQTIPFRRVNVNEKYVGERSMLEKGTELGIARRCVLPPHASGGTAEGDLMG